MAIDIHLLQIAKHRDQYGRIVHSVPRDAVDEKTMLILKDFGRYFDKFPSKSVIDMAAFMNRFAIWHKEFDPEKMKMYHKIFRAVAKEPEDDIRSGILEDLAELGLGTKLANAVSEYEQGNLSVPLSEIINNHMAEFKLVRGKSSLMYNTKDIDELLVEDQDDAGIKWRLDALNKSMRPLRPGDSGIIAGRPDKGKTTFITSEVTYMASQLPEDQNVLWFNNEGTSDRIVKRLYQSALGVGISKMVRLSQKGKLHAKYEEVVGRRDRIRVYDVHGMNIGQLEQLIESNNAGIVIYDMLDNVKGFEGEARTDRQLEEMYKRARELGVQYNHIMLATSQISNEGDGMKFPTLGMLKDSKTGKQGACDFQLMIGAKNDMMFENSRYLGLPKNKLRREGAKGNPQAEVMYLPEVGRYADLEEIEEEIEE